MKTKNITSLLLLITVFIACEDSGVDSNPVESQRGKIVEILNESTVAQESIESIFEEIPGDIEFPFELRCGIKLVSVVYKTIDYNGAIVDASGLIVIPDKEEGKFPLVSLHHGTQSKRENVGSQSFIYAPDAVVAGALGYVAVSPDLLGLGISTTIHPYHHEETSASTPIDLLRAARTYCDDNGIELNDQLFLAGYSHGGYVTAAVQKEIEQNLRSEFTVTAAAPMAGAHDLLGTANYIIANEEYDRPSFLAFFMVAYNEIYGWNDLGYFFTPEYATNIEQLYNGLLTTEEIDEYLTNDLNELFTQSFLTQFRNGTEQRLRNALRNNSLLDFAPIAPVLIVHGDADTYVPYQNAVIARESWLNNGAASVELITVEGGNHVSSILPAIFETIKWFETFREDLILAAK